MILFDVWTQWTDSVFRRHRLLLFRKLLSQPGRDPCTLGVGFLSYGLRQLCYGCLHMSELSKLPCKQHTLLERDLCHPRTDIWNRQGKLQSSCTCLSVEKWVLVSEDPETGWTYPFTDSILLKKPPLPVITQWGSMWQHLLYMSIHDNTYAELCSLSALFYYGLGIKLFHQAGIYWYKIFTLYHRIIEC